MHIFKSLCKNTFYSRKSNVLGIFITKTKNSAATCATAELIISYYCYCSKQSLGFASSQARAYNEQGFVVFYNTYKLYFPFLW